MFIGSLDGKLREAIRFGQATLSGFSPRLSTFKRATCLRGRLSTPYRVLVCVGIRVAACFFNLAMNGIKFLTVPLLS